MSNFLDLMPTINPNLEEIVVDGENVPLTDEKGKPKSKTNQKEIFASGGRKIKLTGHTKEMNKRKNSAKRKKEKAELHLKKDNLRLAVIEENEKVITPPISPTQNEKITKPKKTYPHLVKARAKAKLNREAKKKIKDELRKGEKEAKAQASAEKKKVREAKNRQRNKENYHKKKDLKGKQKDEKTSVIVDEKIIEKIAKVSVVNGEFNYEKFAKFMFQYETDKERYKNETKKKVEKKVVKKVKNNYNTYQARNVPNVVYPEHYINFHKNKRNVNDIFNL
jgi:hypothetical protein